jgi:hypothetical protein
MGPDPFSHGLRRKLLPRAGQDDYHRHRPEKADPSRAIRTHRPCPLGIGHFRHALSGPVHRVGYVRCRAARSAATGLDASADRHGPGRVRLHFRPSSARSASRSSSTLLAHVLSCDPEYPHALPNALGLRGLIVAFQPRAGRSLPRSCQRANSPLVAACGRAPLPIMGDNSNRVPTIRFYLD